MDSEIAWPRYREGALDISFVLEVAVLDARELRDTERGRELRRGRRLRRRLVLAFGWHPAKRRALGTSLAHRAVLGKCRFSNSNQLFQRFHRNSVKTRTLSPAASSNSNSNERELG